MPAPAPRLDDAPAPSVSPESAARELALAAWLRDAGRVLVGYSGGVDSAYLATVAVRTLGASNVLAVIGRSDSFPAEQWRVARTVADRVGIPVVELDTRELDDPRYAANPADRCYFCKSELWSRLAPLAAERGMVVVDGTNADDLHDWRPGSRAAAERGVRSPLADLGFAKVEIRALSARLGLPTWSQPSAPCLASRIPYGTAVTPARLRRVEAAEAALRALGVAGDLRVRDHGETARVEIGAAEIDRWLPATAGRRLRDAVAAAGFGRVLLDLRGFRSGSLNVIGGVVP